MRHSRSHLTHQGVGPKRLGSTDVIAILRRARKDGIEVTADQYPYTASSTSLSATLIPAKYREGSAKDLINRLDDEEIGPNMKKAIAQGIKADVGGKVIKIASYAKNAKWQGKNLLAIAEAEKKSVLDIVIDITRNGGAQIVRFGMSDEDVRLFMKETYVATASDGTSMLPGSTVRTRVTTARSAQDRPLCDRGSGHQGGTRDPQHNGSAGGHLEVAGRGYLKAGYYADIVVFDPKTFRDKATYERPHQYATGVRYLFVNGRLAIDDSQATELRPGRVLRHGSK